MSGTILLIEPDAATRRRVSRLLTRAFYTVVALPPAAVPDRIRCSRDYDLAILGIAHPGCVGLELCQMLKGDTNTALLPVVGVVPRWDQGGAAAFAAGVEDVLLRDIDAEALLARVRSLIRLKLVYDELDLRDRTARDLGDICADVATPVSGEVLIAAASTRMADRWRAALGAHRATVARRLADLFGPPRDGGPDAIVLHQDFAAGSGLVGIVDVRARVATRHTPILFAPRSRDGATSGMALDLGANDYVDPPVSAEELAARVGSLVRRKHLGDRLRRNLRDQLNSALTDPLTGLYNRRYALSHLARQLDQARQADTPLALLILDLDRFKALNDAFGHCTGDLVLRDVGQRIAASVRSADLVARIGGEEFLVVMPGASAGDAARVAERIRAEVRGAGAVLPPGAGRQVTLSAGIAIADPGTAVGTEELIGRADRALYTSKGAGRDRVSVHRAA